MSKIIKVVLLSLVFTLLSACGGGSGDGSNSATYPFRNAFIASLVTESEQFFSLSGSIEGSPPFGSGRVFNSTLSNTPFLATPAQRKLHHRTGSFTVNGAEFSIDQRDYLYYDFNFNYLGQIGLDDFLIVTGSSFLPATVQVGDSGVLYTGNKYLNSSFNTQIGTQSAVFSVDENSDRTFSDSVLLTIEITDYDLLGDVITSTTNLYYLTADERMLPINSVFESETKLITTTYQ